ncbi:MAG: MqnA/MqnD/SBP family protein [Wolinella sp.]
MRFGKIDYINLLPFHIFIKRYPTSASFRKFIELKKSYPSKLNREFLFRRIDAGFISSIAAYKERSTCAGIVIKKRVKSVLALPNREGSDYQSATSNALLQVLGIKGEVLIGDRALKYYIAHKDSCIDMGELWVKRTRLPFVFARLCCNRNDHFYDQIAYKFTHARPYIPRYILNEYATRVDIPASEILDYLKCLSYKLDKKALLGVKKFYNELNRRRIKFPRRFD